MNPQNYTINIRPGWGISQVVKVSQGDVGRPLAFTIMDGQDAITLSSTATVTITGTKPSGLGFTQACTLSGNTASIDTVATMTQESGSVPAELIVTDGDAVIGTANFIMYVEPAAHPDGTTDGDAETARDLMTRAEQAVEQAEAAAEQAEASAEAISQAGIDTTGSTAGQVPTSNGNGSWSWQTPQAGGGGTSDDIENASSVTGSTVSDALNTLSDEIANEATTRTSAVSAVQSAVDSEASTRASADESLRSAIDALVSPSGASVVVDSSLSISGAAADAKVTGDELDDLKSALTFESSVTRNTTTAYPLSWENGTLSNGQPVASGRAVRSPEFIPLADGIIFTAQNIQSSLRLYMAMYDATKTYISQINVGVGTLTPTSADCKYVKLYTYSETTPQAQQASKISAIITNNNSIERTLQTMEINKIDAFNYTSWLVNDGVLFYTKKIEVSADKNNSGDATYIYNMPLKDVPITGPVVVYAESVIGSNIGSPIQLRILDAQKQYIRTVTYKSGVYPHVFVPESSEKYVTVNLYASANGGLSDPAVFKNVFIAMNGYSSVALNSAVKHSWEVVPDYYLNNNYLDNKVATIRSLINDSNGDYDAFIFCTDQHWTLNAKKSPNLINYLMYNLKMPRLFMGGDYGSGINLQAINAFRTAYNGEIVNVTGNHEVQQYYQTEYGLTSGTVTGTMVWAYLNASMTDCVIGNAERNYYYIDNEQQKMRYIILNDWEKGSSNSTPVYQFEQDQIDWFDNALESLPNGYLAVVFIHAISDVNHDTGALTENYAYDAVQGVVDEHSTKVCCILAGHTHFDGVGATNGGVPIIITTCDKALPEEGYDDYLTDIRHIGTITEQAFDVVIINKKDKVINAVRIGCPANNPTGEPLEVRTVSY